VIKFGYTIIYVADVNEAISRDMHLKERPLHFFVIDFAVRLCFHFK